MKFSLARDNDVHSRFSAQGLERNLLTREQLTSQDFSRDMAKVVTRGVSDCPDISFKFKLLFGVGNRVADSQPYKALEDLAKKANTWSQLKRNVQPLQGLELLRELAARNSDLANSLKSIITKGSLRFYNHVGDRLVPARSHSQRLNVSTSSRPKRLSKTRKLEKLVLQDPIKIKMFWKVVDRNFGNSLFKLAKILIVRLTDNTYLTDKGKVYRKNHRSLRHNFNSPEFSATPSSIGEKLQRRIASRTPFQKSTSPVVRQTSEPVRGTLLNLTADSSSEDLVTAGPSLELIEAPGLAPHRSDQATGRPQTPTLPLSDTPAPVLPEATSATPLESSTQTGPPKSADVQSEATTLPASSNQARSDTTRSSGRSKKPTTFFGDPLCHTVKSVTEKETVELPTPSSTIERTPPTPFVPTGRTGCQSPFVRTKDQVTPFKKTGLAEPEK